MAHIGDSHCISVGQHCSRVCGMRKNQQRRPLGGCYELITENFFEGWDHVFLFSFVFLASSTLVPGTYLVCRLGTENNSVKMK